MVELLRPNGRSSIHSNVAVNASHFFDGRLVAGGATPVAQAPGCTTASISLPSLQLVIAMV
jgi:hypothetical protein